MIDYLAGYRRDKDNLFAAIAAVEGGRRLKLQPLSFRAFPETDALTETALGFAKNQPRSPLIRTAKRRLIAAQYNGARRYFAARPGHLAMCWNGMTGSRMAFMEGAKAAGAPRLYVELAPFPDRITLDHTGLAAEASLPRDPDFYRDWAQGRDTSLWRNLGANLTARQSRRRDVGQAQGTLPDTPFLFAPLQVPNDSQITRFGGWTGSVPGFVAALAKAAKHLPEGWHIRVKEHPSAKVALGDEIKGLADDRLVIDNTTDTFAQVAASRGVITINSSVGLQAMFHDKPVLVLGRANFALPDIATPIASQPALDAALANPDDIAFNPDLRAAFFHYLDVVYYPKTSRIDGRLTPDPEAVKRKIAEARAAV